MLNQGLFQEQVPAPEADADAEARMRGVREHLGECRRCGLCEDRRTIVFGRGDPGARLLVAGEAPGAYEDSQGVPFSGPAGDMLGRMLTAIGVQTEDAYLCNAIKCHSPERAATKNELAACAPFLEA